MLPKFLTNKNLIPNVEINPDLNFLGTETAFGFGAKVMEVEKSGKFPQVYKFHIGDTGPKTPQPIIDVAIKAMQDKQTKYAPYLGYPQVRENIAKYWTKVRGVEIRKENIILMPGGKPGIEVTMQALLCPGDKVIYQNPGYPIYESLARLYSHGNQISWTAYQNPENKKLEYRVEDLAKILEENKPETIFLIGIAYALNEKFDDAENYFNQALELGFEPQSEINQRLADLSLLKEDFEKALQSYFKVIESGAADENIFTKAVWICIEKLKKPARAIGIAETAVRTLPETAESYNLLGWAFTAYGDYQKAQTNLLKALEKDPAYASAYLNLGWMYEKQSLLSTAKEYYKKAYAFGGQNPIASLAATRFNNISSYMKANITK